jgi:hypothetical protein
VLFNMLAIVQNRRMLEPALFDVYMASATPAVSEGHCREQLRKLRQRLERLGVAPDLVEQEVSSYEAALRAEVWRQVLTPGGAA